MIIKEYYQGPTQGPPNRRVIGCDECGKRSVNIPAWGDPAIEAVTLGYHNWRQIAPSRCKPENRRHYCPTCKAAHPLPR